jgi:hypothetical protein
MARVEWIIGVGRSAQWAGPDGWFDTGSLRCGRDTARPSNGAASWLVHEMPETSSGLNQDVAGAFEQDRQEAPVGRVIFGHQYGGILACRSVVGHGAGPPCGHAHIDVRMTEYSIPGCTGVRQDFGGRGRPRRIRPRRAAFV